MRALRFVSILLILTTAIVLHAADAVPGRPYLALGDSVPFGFINNAGFAYLNPDNFIGYPNYVGRSLMFDTVNASCPGETSASFLSSSAPDRGCHLYRSQVPLHVAYSSTQLDFAVAFLKSHPETKVVTISIGANDVFLLEDQCAGDLSCVASELPQVLAAVTANLETILADVRAAGFKGTIVVVNYYSDDYSDANLTSIFTALNQALAAVAAPAGAPVADVFTAFQTAAGPAGGHTCNVGLLNASQQNEFVCDIHPSQSGQALIARTVEQTLVQARGQ